MTDACPRASSVANPTPTRATASAECARLRVTVRRKSSTMEVADIAIKPVRDFAKDSIRLVKKCTKPSADEFWKIAARTATGFVIMGFVGFFVKLVFIPINNIILSA